MNEILHVGLEVDDKSFHAALIGADGEFFEFRTKPTNSALVNKFREFESKGYELKICYEATFLGFSLCRMLRDEKFLCEVIAPSLTPEVKGRKVKTDRLDALKLAKLYMNGLLTIVNVPDQEDEVVRDLLRSRSFLSSQLKSTKQHIVFTCRRQGIDYKKSVGGEYWTVKHREWLLAEIKKITYEALKINLNHLLSHLGQLEGQIELYDAEVERLSNQQRFKQKVLALNCYRGFSTNASMTMITEIGDIKRFSHPTQLMSFAGLDIAEYSSGAHQRRYRITKLGNKFIRTVAIEASQSCSKPPIVSKAVKIRRDQANLKQIEVADRCMKRLYKKSTHLLAREKSKNIVKVACAREMLGFIWESLSHVSIQG
jgi:transposase